MDQLIKLIDRREIAQDTMAFWFDIKGKNYSFEAGQHADFTLVNPPHTDDKGNTRTFSFASSPNDKEKLMIATRMRGSGFKNSLRQIPLGTEVEVSEPMGSFVLHEDTEKPAVFLIGGIGITPVRSIVSFATEEKLPHQIYLFYSNTSLEEAAFMEDLKTWETANSNFHFIPTLTGEAPENWQGETGRIDENMIKKNIPDIKSCRYYMSGPHNMIVAMYRLITGLGVSRDDIKTEEFAGY